MTSVLQHDNALIRYACQVLVIESGIVKNLALERLRSIYQQTAAFKSRIYIVGKAINVLLIFIDCVQIHLECPIRIQVEKQGSLENLIMNFSFDFFNRVCQRHLPQTACNGDSLLDHLLTRVVQVGVLHATHWRSIQRYKSFDQVRVHARKRHGSLGPETVAHQCHVLVAIIDACLTHITLNIRRQRPVVHHRVPL